MEKHVVEDDILFTKPLAGKGLTYKRARAMAYELLHPAGTSMAIMLN